LGKETIVPMIYKLGVQDIHSPTWEGMLRILLEIDNLYILGFLL
jgi:hypothetical protein